MKCSARLRSLCGLMLMFCLLATPIAAMGGKGKKNYERGLRYEAAQQWEKAVEEFILAVAAEPANIQYQLHYRRAIFNASQEAMRQGDALAAQKDYLGAYNAFRQASRYDPTNQLAVSEAERVLRLKTGGEAGSQNAEPNAEPATGGAEAKITPASQRTDLPAASMQGRQQQPQQQASQPLRTEQLRVINFNGDLKNFIRTLADQLHVDVLFDGQSFQKPRNIEVRLHDVTTAKALDFIFMQEGLFFQKLDRNTIFVADQSRRPQFQELVIQTFYLANIDPNDARSLIQAAIPAQQGRPSATVIPNKSTNSITVRDTEENIRLISNLIESIDKDLAEVVMEVNIYEMQHNDLLRLGNQIGTADTLGAIFGTSGLLAPVAQGNVRAAAGSALTNLPTALGAAFLLPASTFSAFQQRDRSRLLASTQIHAFDRESSRARIGQRVPVQTAQVTSLGFTSGSGSTAPPGGTSGLFGGTGYPVINYEPVGLTLDFTPQVFPNLDVQVKMNIESKDVQGLGSLTPTFTERSISGTARIRNNQTMMIASVAQDNQARGRQGLPLLGLVPVLGRLFSTPTQNDFQTDIVITVTPHVMRAPAITPRDLGPHPSGSQQMPISGSLEAMMRESEQADQLARVSNTSVTQPLAPQTRSNEVTNVSAKAPSQDEEEPPLFTPAPKALMRQAGNVSPANEARVAYVAGPTISTPISTNVSPAAQDVSKAVGLDQNLNPAAEADHTSRESKISLPPVLETAPLIKTSEAQPLAARESLKVGAGEIRFERELQEMRVGEKRRIGLLLKTDAPLSLAVIPLRFDPRIISVRVAPQGYSFSNVQTGPIITQTFDPQGALLVSLSPPADASAISAPGALLYLDIEALAAGESSLGCETGTVHLMAPGGRDINTQIMQGRISVK
ncbi:MAG TPA: secretin N-terminal domain-containing protein [Pyrinomonadaceae bacterium]|nr:secretin N-terminal domain-containing protein [Pyrinomonadaceae bacterium]